MSNTSEAQTISGTTCALRGCGRPVPKGTGVRRGDLRTVTAWHRDCFTIYRATKEAIASVEADEEIGGTLTERLARAGVVRA